jgi:hypothetical protein
LEQQPVSVDLPANGNIFARNSALPNDVINRIFLTIALAILRSKRFRFSGSHR